MRRRDFVSAAGLAGVAAAASAFPKPSIAQGKRQWLLTTAFGKAGLLGQAIDSFAKFVTSASDGALSIKVYHANELVPAFEAFDAVQNGTAQMGYGAPYYWKGKSEAISFVSSMPFGLTAQEQNAWFYYNDGIALSDKIYNHLGCKFLPMGNTGNQMGGWYRKEINSVEDLKGLKYRMPGLGGEILSTFGVTVTNLPGSDVLSSLASGAIDGTEWIGPAADLGFGLYKVCDYYYYPGWHEPASVLDGFINLDEWNSLDANLKDLIEKAAAAHNLWLLSEFQARNNAALQKLINEHGVKLKYYGDELVKAFSQRADTLLPEIANRDPLGKEIYANLKAFKKTMVEWSGFSEGAFIRARSMST